ncbi:VOC family protein [Pseudoalteromonas fenneropenaei]|uniref:VOC family protein n=1 Tax=Pseudoalteromonas fenneropenaei TaxID=1737459 RepID=A0ABV7CIU0_9GAMM
MSIQGVNHITLTVSNLDRALHFYCQVLGFKAEVKWAKGAYLSAPNVWLCLNLGEPQPAQDYSHIAFSASITTIDKLKQQLSPDQLWQDNRSEGASLYLLDPDGHKLELHHSSLSSRLAALSIKPYQDLEWL